MFKSTLRSLVSDIGQNAGRVRLTPNRTATGAIGFLLGAGAFAMIAAAPSADAPIEVSPVATNATADPATDDPRDFTAGFVDVADATVPGVVRIETRRTGRSITDVAEGVPPALRFFFDGQGFGSPRAPMMPQQPRQALSGGTGFVVSEDGLILTNHHVVDDAEEITVWLHDRRSFVASLVGSDPTTDVAVLRIEGDDLPALPIGSSDDVRVGEWILAVGNPGFRGGNPLEETVTVGIVSAVGRPLSVIRSGLAEDPNDRSIAQWAIEDFIQTDAVINPGNSGGPLVNMAGEVVGMNTAIMSTSGYYQGYGFAIPIDLVLGVMDDLVEHGQVRRAWLGVRISDVTSEDAEAFDLPEIRGVLVQGVTEDGPGEEAGLEMGDVIVAVDGTPVDRVGALQQRIARAEPDSRVSLTVIREGEQKSVAVRLGEAPFETARQSASEVDELTGADLLGLEFSAITPRLRERLGVDWSEGVVVMGVDNWGPAAGSVVAGTRVLSVNRVPIDDVDDLERSLEDVTEGTVVSLVLEDASGTTWISNVRARATQRGGGE